MDCSKLTSGLVAAICCKPAIAGTNSRVILLNYSDIDRALSVVDAKNVITSMILKVGAKGYAFESLDNATVGELSLNKGTYASNWQHDVTLRIFTKNEDVKSFINKLPCGRVVLIVENKETGNAGDIVYEAYGWDSGLELNEASTTTEMADTIVYTLKMGSGENSKESTIPKSVFKTDLATTVTMLESLLV